MEVQRRRWIPIWSAEKYSRNKTSVIISHRLGAIRQCDRICFLEDGRIVNMGTHDELMAECPDYAQLYHAQAKWFRGGEVDRKSVV